MNSTEGPKKGNLSLSRGGLYASRELSPDEWLDREVRALFASWKSNAGQGAYASRGIANAVHGINFPHRILARRIREAHEQRVRHELVRRLGELFAEYADRLARKPRPAQPNRAA